MKATGNAGIRFLISVAVIGLALLLEYAFSDGGVLRWMMSQPGSLESPIELTFESPFESADEPPEQSPPAEVPAPPPPEPAAGTAAPGFGLRVTRAQLPLPYEVWLSALWPGMSRQDVLLSKSALGSLPQVERPPYGYGSDGQPIQGLDVDGYQVFPLVDKPPLAVSLLFLRGKLHRWMVYEQDTRGLAEDQAQMLKLYASTVAGNRPAPVAAVAANDDNRLSDPSFEADPDADDPEWQFDAAGGDALGARTSDAAHNGGFSITIEASTGANQGWPGWHTSTRFPLEPGQSYALRAHALSPDGASAWLDMQLFDRSGKWLGGRSTGCRMDLPRKNSWDVLELRLRADDEPRAATVQLGLLQCLNYSKGRTTRLFYDDVFFGVVSPGT